MDDKDKVYSKLWQRLGLFEVWDRSMLVFALTVTALLSYAFDAVRLNSYSLAWLPVNGISFGGAVLLVVLLVRIAKAINLAPKYRASVNLAIASIAMGCKNVATLYLCETFGIQDSGSWAFRFVGGASIGVSILVMYSNLRGAKIERMLVMAELLEKEKALRGFRENITDIFAEEQEELTERTTAELLPRLLQLQEKVQLGSDSIGLAAEFEKMLSQDVKPLSASLANQANQLKLAVPSFNDIKPSKLDVRINLAKSIRPVSTGLLVFFGWWMLAQIVIPSATILDVGIATLIFQATLLLIQLLVRKVKRATVNQALLFTPWPGAIASVPSYLLFYQIPDENVKKFLLPTFLVVGGWACVSFTLAYILDRGRQAAEEKLTSLLNQFSRENKLFEQRLWIAQHVWYTLLHGSVQAALTAAAIRATGKTELTEQEQQAILGDLSRAIESLKNPQIESLSFDKTMNDLKQTWLGICEINVMVDQNVALAFNKNADAKLVCNEVIKEAVSNAVKHGQASNIEVTLQLNQQADILIQVKNDGQELRSVAGSGIGSKIFNAVCLEFGLSTDEQSKKTIFTAIVPQA